MKITALLGDFTPFVLLALFIGVLVLLNQAGIDFSIFGQLFPGQPA